MFLPLTVAATVLSLLSVAPPLQAPRASRINVRIVAVIVNFAVLCTLDCYSFEELLGRPSRACLTTRKTVCYKLRFNYCLLLTPMGLWQSLKLWRYCQNYV